MVLSTGTTIQPAGARGKKRRKREGDYVEETVNVVEILVDNAPREGSETFTVELTRAMFGGTPLEISDTYFQVEYTIEDASGMFVLMNLQTNMTMYSHLHRKKLGMAEH